MSIWRWKAIKSVHEIYVVLETDMYFGLFLDLRVCFRNLFFSFCCYETQTPVNINPFFMENCAALPFFEIVEGAS